MTDQIAILTIAVTIAFAFGMAVGTASERARQRRRKAQQEINWMRDVPPRDAGGFVLEKNPHEQGSQVSAAGSAFYKWAKENPPPQDGHTYIANALTYRWERYYHR